MYLLREKLKLVVVLLIHVFKSSAGSINMPYTEEQNIYIAELLELHDVREKLQSKTKDRIKRALLPVYHAFQKRYNEYKGSFEAFKSHWENLVATCQAERKTAPALTATFTWAPAEGSQRTRNKYTKHMVDYAFALEELTYTGPTSNELTIKERWWCIWTQFLKKFPKYKGCASALHAYCSVQRRTEQKKLTSTAQQSEGDTSPRKESEVDTMLSSKSSPSELQTDTDTELETDGNDGLPESQVVFNVPMGALAGVKDPMDVLEPETWSVDADGLNTTECPKIVINKQNEWLDYDNMEEMHRWLGEDGIKQPEVREDVPENEPPKKRAKVTIHHDSNVSSFPEGPFLCFLTI